MRVEVKAEIIIRKIPNKRERDSIIKSLEPDNVGIEETTRILTEEIDDGLSITVEAECKLGLFIHTQDDLLSCLATPLRRVFRNP